MPWNKSVTADAVIQRLYEDKGLYQMTNRSYDPYVRAGATSVRRPKLATLVAKKNEGATVSDADRKNTKSGTTMVETDLDLYTVPIFSELTADFESNGAMRREYEISMSQALRREFNKAVIEAAQATSYTSNWAGASLAWADYVAILKHFDTYEVPEEDRVIVTPAAVMDQFYNIDVIKTAVGFNKEILAKGMGNQMLGASWFISGLVPTIGGKQTVVGWSKKGLAFILSRFGEIKETYDPGESGVRKPGDVIDMCAHAGTELDDDVFAVIKKQP